MCGLKSALQTTLKKDNFKVNIQMGHFFEVNSI